MALVVDTAVSRVRENLETRKTRGICASYGPQATRHFGVVSILCTTHQGVDEVDLASQIADEIKDLHLTAPEYLQTEKVVEQDIANANRSLRVHLRSRPSMSVTVMNLNQRSWTIGHIGVNRAWLFRGARLQQLTRDHSMPSPSGPPVFEKVCGQSEIIEPDIISGQLESEDILLITSPGIHNNLDGATIMSCLIGDWSAKKIAEEIVNRTNDARVKEEVAVTVLRVGKLPRPEVSISRTSPLPKCGGLPEIDQVIDRFLIERRIRKGRLSNYYKARDTLNDADVMLKFPSPEFMKSPEMVKCFINDEWLSKKQNSQSFIPGYPIARGRRSQLYSVYEYRRGENLARRIKRKQTLALGEILLIANQLVHTLESMHAERMAHRDIRPENIVLDKRNKQIFLLGIDLQRINYILRQGPKFALDILSPQYLPPEIFRDPDWGAQSDIFATGVTLYQMACGTFPYGRVPAPEEILRRKFKSPKTYNASLPDKFVEILTNACSPLATDRYQTIKQLGEALSEINPDKTTARASFLRRKKSRR
jgi:hypothetical protein